MPAPSNRGFFSPCAALGRPHDPSKIGSNVQETVVWGQFLTIALRRSSILAVTPKDCG